ncbi:MAG: DNA-binding protein [Candidatus Omnitrophota bacterium]
MTNNLKLISTILFFVLAFGQETSFSQSINSNELIKNSKQYDGKLVTYAGEIIGDVMVRGRFAWVNINDGNNALGIWMSSALAKDINFSGSYKVRGDIIEVVGVFHRACLEHGGDLDIHAQTLRKTGTGRIVNQKLNIDKIYLSLILLGLLFLIWILTLFKRR